MKVLKRIAAVIAGTGLIGLSEVAAAQTALAQFVDDIAIPSIQASGQGTLTGNLTSIATIDGQTFYITENNRTDEVGNTVPGVVGQVSRSGLGPTVPPFAGGTPNPTQFGSNSPNGVAVDLMGNVYVADTGNNEIDIFNSNRVPFPDSLMGFNNPNGVAVNLSNGNIYVADTGNNEVDIVDSSGNISTLNGEGLFNNPNRVAVNSSNGNIYVADTGNNEVDIFNSDLEQIDSLTGFFNSPIDVAVDSFGNVSVVDAGNKEVDLFDSSLQLNFTQSGFNNPTGLTVDLSGRVYVLDAGERSISELTTTPVPEPSSALGILAFGAMGAAYMLKRKPKKSNSHLTKSV